MLLRGHARGRRRIYPFIVPGYLILFVAVLGLVITAAGLLEQLTGVAPAPWSLVTIGATSSAFSLAAISILRRLESMVLVRKRWRRWPYPFTFHETRFHDYGYNANLLSFSGAMRRNPEISPGDDHP